MDGLLKPTIFVAGRGEVELDLEMQYKRLRDVIAENDPEGKLTLGRHNTTGEWVLFLKPRAHPYGLDAPYPVLGLGTDLPDPQELRELLYRTDTRRNGDQILKDIHANNEKLRAKSRTAADDGIEIAAEAAESFLHRQSLTPHHRSLRKVDPVHRQFSGKEA